MPPVNTQTEGGSCAEEDALSGSSIVGVTASTASGSGHEVNEEVVKTDASEANGTLASNVALEKHPLQHTWCLWVLLHDQSTKDNWEVSQQMVHAFSTVEDFWRLFNNIKGPSRLGIIDFSVFKKDVVPAWEDDTCRRGGRWLAKIDKMRPKDFDDLWHTLLLTCVGEGLGEPGNSICGAVVSARVKNSKMALWMSEREEGKVMHMGRAFYKILQAAGFSGEIAFEDFTTENKAAFTVSDGKVEGRKDAKVEVARKTAEEVVP
mmetsp:Transcript_6438/g.10356  ORF Transcript_6438/g.10356 Transcript_6438/m.10356 type:complete len:263 (-) Transcript_6438:95-883(-)